MQILQTIWTALTTENNGLITAFSVPFSLLEAYISMLIFLQFLDVKSNKISKTLYVFIFPMAGFITSLLLSNPFNTFINFIIFPIIIMLLFHTNLLTSIMCEIIPIFLLGIVDFILIKLFNVIGISSSDIIHIPLYRFITSIIEYTILFCIYLLIKKKNFHINFLQKINMKQNTLFILNSILGIITICFQTYVFIFYVNSLPHTTVLLSITSLISYFIISFYSLISTNKLNVAKQNLEETRLMNKTLTILNDKIRAFRHDFNNIIQALGGYIQAKDMDGLEKYYSQLLKDCQEVTNLSGLNQESINNPAIYSLLASKYYLATEKGIEFDLDIFMDLNSIDMKIYEFCRILGILLDNAIQATQECEEKQITVTIRKDNRCKRQLLIVENTYKEKDIDTEKIFEKGYSTKEGNTGLGLWEVRQILLKNTNLNLFTSKDDKYFKQQLEIYKS